MVIGVVVIIVLLSYLQLLEGRTITRARSLSWNSAIPVLEAGIEEAFTHLYRDPTALTSNGWTNSQSNGNTIYSRRRNFPDGSYCLVTISNVSSVPFVSPVIYSQGFVPAPLAQGYISRMVQVTLTNPVTFPTAIACKNLIDLSGQSQVDSFDSSRTNYSTGGQYDPAKRKDNAPVVTNSKAKSAIDVGNGHIYGKTDTGPGGTVGYNGSGTVGDLTWSASHSGIETGYTNDDMNVSYPDNTAPSGYSSWLPAAPGLYKGALYAYALGSAGYKFGGNFSLKGDMIVTGDASLYIGGDFTVSGSITIAPGATLKIYVAGGTTTISGGGIVNSTGTAASLSYYGLPGNTTIGYSGGSDFIGTINAPEADFKLTGGSSVVGAVILNSYTSKSSKAAFHYDEALAGVGPLKLVAYKEL